MRKRRSPIDSLKGLPKSEILEALADLSDLEALALLYDWRGVWARPDQLPPPDPWFAWFIEAGRGFGKTRTGAELVTEWARELGPEGRIALVARTEADYRDTMIEGESGLVAVSPPDFRAEYHPSLRRVTWPNGCQATAYSATQPDLLRGPQHHKAWCDELAAYRYLGEAWSNLVFGLRLGDNPQIVATTTPRPRQEYRALRKRSGVVFTRGSTYANAENLPATFLAEIRDKYEGTRIGRQEIEAEILDETPGALWTLKLLDSLRVRSWPALDQLVVSVDPAASSNDDSDEHGITVGGTSRTQAGAHRGYLLEDASLRGTPDEWGSVAIELFHRYEADHVVAEVNNGGEMVKDVIQSRDPTVPVKMVHASRGKFARAEPVSALYEQRKIHHCGSFPELEDQQTNWVPGSEKSPDRLDSVVWLWTDLMIKPGRISTVSTDHLDDLDIGRPYDL